VNDRDVVEAGGHECLVARGRDVGGRPTKQTLTETSLICMSRVIGEHIGHCHDAERTYRRLMGNSVRNSRGQFLVKRTTPRDRMRATLRRVTEELRRRMHEPIPEQGAWLKQVVRGYFAYHAVPTNGPALGAFYYHVTRIWLRTLRRRGQKDRFSWQRMHR
jgi:hypothetical protein